NNGIFTASSSSLLQAWGDGGTPSQFNNNPGATFTKQGSGTVSFVPSSTDVNFNNSATVDVQAGTLGLDAGGTHNNDFSVASGATLRLGGTHSFSASADITGAGTLSVASGSATLDGTISGLTLLSAHGGTSTFNGTANFAVGATLNIGRGTVNFNTPTAFAGGTISDGTLSGTATVNISGTLNWTGAVMSGSGTTIMGANSVLNLSSSSTKSLQRRLQLNGSANWTGGEWRFNGGRVDNNGIFTASSSSLLQAWGDGGTPSQFNNNPGATFTKQGSGTVSFV